MMVLESSGVFWSLLVSEFGGFFFPFFLIGRFTSFAYHDLR